MDARTPAGRALRIGVLMLVTALVLVLMSQVVAINGASASPVTRTVALRTSVSPTPHPPETR